jgi:hypothetical protein
MIRLALALRIVIATTVQAAANWQVYREDETVMKLSSEWTHRSTPLF